MTVKRCLAVAAVGMFAVCWTLPARAGGGQGGECMTDAEPAGDAPRVLVLDACFRPDLVTIQAGQVVQWDLRASMPHTVMFANGEIDSGTLSDSFAVKFRRPGTYRYSCVFHPGMVGTVEAIGAAMDGGPALEIVEAGPSRAPATAIDPSEEAVALAADGSTTDSLILRLDPLSGLLLILFGLSVGAGATGAARVLRGR